MFGFGKKKSDKAAWAEAVYGQKLKHPEKESEEQISALTTGLLIQHHRIILDSVRLVHTTKNVDTREGRIDLCRKHYHEMLELKPLLAYTAHQIKITRALSQDDVFAIVESNIAYRSIYRK